MSYMPAVTGIANGNTVGTSAEVTTLQGGTVYQVYITGTFTGSASVQPYIEAPDGTWCAIGDAVTAAAAVNIQVPSGRRFTVGVTGGDVSTSIDIDPHILEKNK
jgi:hypothetical protein